jgi:hypothetical protein
MGWIQEVVISVKSKLLTDIPSLNRAPQVETSVVLAARLEEAPQNGQMVAFQAGYQMASTHSNKRPLQEETWPYASAPDNEKMLTMFYNVVLVTIGTEINAAMRKLQRNRADFRSIIRKV